MAKKPFLLDGMALVYRTHFALITRPILTSSTLSIMSRRRVGIQLRLI
jgi:hypothetical protein